MASRIANRNRANFETGAYQTSRRYPGIPFARRRQVGASFARYVVRYPSEFLRRREPVARLLDLYARAFYPKVFKPEKAAAWLSASEQARAAGHSVSARVPSP